MAKIIVGFGFSLLCAVISAVFFVFLWCFLYFLQVTTDFAIYDYIAVGAIAGFLLGIYLFTRVFKHYID